jgi:hypothetical protein
MGFLKPKMPPPLPPVQPLPEPPPAAPVEMSDEEKETISKEQAAIERRRRGRKSTILTSPLGIQESEESKLKTLLGE